MNYSNMNTQHHDILVSVIIPAYNSAYFIADCIQSILEQTLQSFEIIVVNDASPDHLVSVVSQFAAKDPRIKILNNERNRGQSVSRYKGLLAATGKTVMFLDSDDTLDHKTLEVMYNELMQENAEMGVFCYQQIGFNNKITTFPSSTFPRLTASGYEFLQVLFSSNSHRKEQLPFIESGVANKIFRKNFLMQQNLQPLSINTSGGMWFEDFYMLTELLLSAKKVVFRPEPFYHYNKINPKSTSTQRKNLDMVLSVCYAMEQIKQLLITRNVYLQMKDKFYSCYLDEHVYHYLIPLLIKYKDKKFNDAIIKRYSENYKTDPDFQKEIRKRRYLFFFTSAIKYSNNEILRFLFSNLLKIQKMHLSLKFHYFSLRDYRYSLMSAILGKERYEKLCSQIKKIL